MTEAEKFLLTQKENFFWSILSIGAGTHICPRACFLQHHEKIGFFYYTKTIYRKIGQIEKNPHVTVSIAPKGSMTNVVAHCSARVSADPKELDLVYSDDIKKFGYTGRDDARLRIIVLTIHSVVHESKVYAGVPIDPKTYDIDRITPIEPLPAGPYDNKGAGEVIKKHCGLGTGWHLITWNGLHHEDRMLETMWSDEIGLYQVTHENSKKGTEIETNHNVALLFEIKETNDQIVVDAVGFVCRCPDVKKKVWLDTYKGYGFSGPDDVSLVVLKYHLRSVTLHSLKDGLKTTQCEPTQYDKDTQLMYKAAIIHSTNFFTTVDEKGVPHTRIMGKIFYHPTLGFSLATHESNKAEQIRKNPHGTITLHDCNTSDEYIFDVDCKMVSSPMYRYALWTDLHKSAGVTGPEDTRSIHVVLAVRKAQVVNVNQFWKDNVAK
jgi:general stress protein 26